jgi:hypothetical protein
MTHRAKPPGADTGARAGVLAVGHSVLLALRSRGLSKGRALNRNYSNGQVTIPRTGEPEVLKIERLLCQRDGSNPRGQESPAARRQGGSWHLHSPIEGDRKTSPPTRTINLQKGTRVKDSEYYGSHL